MKKIFSLKLLGFLVICTALFVLSVSAFAATVAIDSATTSGSDTLSDTIADAPSVNASTLITVDATISIPNADVTLVVVDASKTLADVVDSDIMYIDQETADSSGKASITFRMPIGSAETTYAVYVGGTEVESIAVKYFKFGSSSAETYLSGDVTVDNEVNSTDAIAILRYSIGLENPERYIIENGDVDGNGTVNSTDAIYILRYGIGLENPSSVVIGEEVTK